MSEESEQTDREFMDEAKKIKEAMDLKELL